ncbi:MAG TPA: hypothetical protein VGJ07_01355 [Rugosimonospora sp.]
MAPQGQAPQGQAPQGQAPQGQAPGQPAAAGAAPAPGGPIYEQRPVRSHRQRVYGSALRRRIGATIAVIAALAVGSLVIDHVPDVDTQHEPYLRTGSVGKLVDVRTFDVSVLSVRGAAVIGDSDSAFDSDSTHNTSGVWVLVRIRLVAVDKPMSVSYAAVHDAEGRTYLASERFDQRLVDGEYTLQPGVPVAGEVAFEVPVAVASQLSIRLAAPAQVHDLRMDAMADISLRIDAGAVRQWKATTKPVTPAVPTVVR